MLSAWRSGKNVALSGYRLRANCRWQPERMNWDNACLLSWGMSHVLPFRLPDLRQHLPKRARSRPIFTAEHLQGSRNQGGTAQIRPVGVAERAAFHRTQFRRPGLRMSNGVGCWTSPYRYAISSTNPAFSTNRHGVP